MADLELASLDGRTSSAFVSVSPDNAHVGLSQAAMGRLEAENKGRLLLAFDQEKNPWVGSLGPEAANGHGVSISAPDGGSAKCQSQSLQAKLRRFVTDGERTRLYFSPETEVMEVDGETVEMHRLMTPEGD